MDIDGPDSLLARPSPTIATIFRPPSPPHSRSYENIKRASFSSQVSSRRSSHSRRRRLDAHRKSDASSFGDRRGSQPIVNFRPLDHPPGSAGLPQQQPISQLPNYDPHIYDQLSTFTFGAPPSGSAPPSASGPTFGSPSQPTIRRRRSYSQSADDTDASVEEVDEEERLHEERAKLRAMDDGSRRPSLPINFPPGADRRRSTIFRLANGVDGMHMDNVPEERPQETMSLPSRLEPKPLPALPLAPFHALQSQPQLLHVQRAELRSRLEASVAASATAAAAASGYDHSYSMEPESDAGSPKPGSDASNAPSPQANGSDARESSPSGGVMESAGFQAILDHEWGTAFHIPANLSPRSSLAEDPFMKMVEQFDPVYNRNKYAWTFKKLPSLKKQANGANEARTGSEPPNGTPGPSAKGKEREAEKEQPEVVMWNCQNVGQYGMWPGRSTANGEHRRPSVLYAVSGEGSKRRGPTYLIHKHSRCHAFSIFQGYQVTGQKILASHAMLLSNKAIQYSFANSPEHKSSSKPARPHEPYEDDPDVMKLQTHQLVEEEPEMSMPYKSQEPADVSTGSPKPASKRHSLPTPDRTLSRKNSNDMLRTPARGAPLSLPQEEEKSEMETLAEKTEGSVTSSSTLMPAPRITPHAIAFEAMDHTMTSHALHRASNTRFEWFRRAFGTGKPVGTAPRYPGHNVHPTQTSIDSAYSPPWLLMAPQSVKQEEERIIQNLNDSFRAVGLIPPPKTRTPGHAPKSRRSKPRSAIIDSIPRDAMMMLMPLWIAEGGSATGVSKHHVPMTERTYLLVYYVPFDSSSRSGESSRSAAASKKRPRKNHDRSDRKKSLVSDRTMLSTTLEEMPPVPPIPEPMPKKPKKCSFRVVARMLTYADVRESGIKLPRFGLAVHGSLSDALVGNPTYHAMGENYSAVIAVCHGAESGMELVTEGLDKLGLRRVQRGLADEQQIALGAMEMDATAMEEELEARQQPLTPIGKSVVEMIFAGCVSILEVGFR